MVNCACRLCSAKPFVRPQVHFSSTICHLNNSSADTLHRKLRSSQTVVAASMMPFVLMRVVPEFRLAKRSNCN